MKIIKLKTAEISEASFSDTTIYRGERLNRESVLDLRNHFKPTEIPVYFLRNVSPSRSKERLC